MKGFGTCTCFYARNCFLIILNKYTLNSFKVFFFLLHEVDLLKKNNWCVGNLLSTGPYIDAVDLQFTT